MTTGRRFLLFSISLLSLLGCAEQGSLTIDDPWVRPLPPGMEMTAAYAQVRNDSASTIEFCTVSSSRFESVELHETVLRDGVARMRAVDAFALAPGQTATLQPGGMHLMLMQPQGEIAEGQAIDLTVEACDGQSWRLSVPVRSL